MISEDIRWVFNIPGFGKETMNVLWAYLLDPIPPSGLSRFAARQKILHCSTASELAQGAVAFTIDKEVQRAAPILTNRITVETKYGENVAEEERKEGEGEERQEAERGDQVLAQASPLAAFNAMF